jgi:hypothetical protein
MTTSRAALHIASTPVSSADLESPDFAGDADPLRRLEAELQRVADCSDDERLHGQAWSLLEEAWGLVTECLVLRDGLLDACHEIEQTMDGIQRRLQPQPSTGQDVRGRVAGDEQSAVSGSRGGAMSSGGGAMSGSGGGVAP